MKGVKSTLRRGGGGKMRGEQTVPTLMAKGVGHVLDSYVIHVLHTARVRYVE